MTEIAEGFELGRCTDVDLGEEVSVATVGEGVRHRHPGAVQRLVRYPGSEGKEIPVSDHWNAQ